MKVENIDKAWDAIRQYGDLNNAITEINSESDLFRLQRLADKYNLDFKLPDLDSTKKELQNQIQARLKVVIDKMEEI